MNTDGIIGLIARIREKANEVIDGELARRGVSGIVSSHGNILVQPYHHGPLPMNRLANLIGRKKNTFTVLVRELNQAGYLKLGKSQEDNQVTMVELTEQGEAFRQQFQEISTVLLERVWGDMPRAERETALALLGVMLGAWWLEDHRPWREEVRLINQERGRRLEQRLLAAGYDASTAAQRGRRAAQEPPRVISVVPRAFGREERCLTCHQGIEAIGKSHPVEAVGCVVCHGGQGEGPHSKERSGNMNP